MKNWKKIIIVLLAAISLCLSSCEKTEVDIPGQQVPMEETAVITLDSIPEYNGEPYVEINGNVPNFSKSDFSDEAYESYSELDSLGRCGVCMANIGVELMPTQERGQIGQIKPSGWQLVKYDFVDGKYLYNRCHLIGYQLSGENANVKNLITGTRYLNVEGMLPFENQVADYVKSTKNHVLYRVTPIFEGSNLVASGVQIEAQSYEDKGAGICLNVYVYNCQPGVVIDYATGISALADNKADTVADSESQLQDKDSGTNYILNTNTHKFHYPTCSSVDDMKAKNKKEYQGNREDLIKQGYEPCKRCNP